MDLPKFKTEYGLKGIDLLPHRPPFLFVDELVSADETGCVGRYTFTAEKNDFFKGHFPSYPVVPGVVLVEAMAQAAGAAVVARKVLPVEEGGAAPLFFLAHIDAVKFRRQVRPGDTLTTVVENTRVRPPLGVFSLKGYVDGELAAEAVVKCMLGSPKKKGE